MKKIAIALVSLPLLALSGAALAGDAAAGAEKAAPCLDCHMNDDFSGLSAEEIAGMITAAQAGEDHDPIVKDLAEGDVADVAAWFAHEGAK
jgi:cytochrome c553